MKNPVAHYVEGRNAWNVGLVGGLIRIKGMIIVALVTFFTMGSPWWWSSSTPSSVTFPLSTLALFSALFLTATFVVTLAYLRKRTMRSLEMKYLLHKLTHDIRDHQTALHRKLILDAGQTKEGLIAEELVLLLSNTCENLAAYFRQLIGNNSIAIAIRLVHLSFLQNSRTQ